MQTHYRIGELAKIKNIDAQTLRFYDQKGVLTPEIVDEQNGYRYYTIDQCVELDRIKFYKLLNLSLEEIKAHNEIENSNEAIETLASQKAQLDRKIAHMQIISENVGGILDAIDHAKSEAADSKRPFKIKQCLTITGIVGDCATVNDWHAFNKKLKELSGLYPDHDEIGHHYGMSFVYASPYLTTPGQEHLRSVIIPVHFRYKNAKHVQSYPLGRCIVAYHQGTPGGIETTLRRVRKVVDKQKLKLRGEVVTTSIISRFIVNNENEYIIEIKLPLADQ